MGQRHQVYVIARVRPYGGSDAQSRYRCIAALHHQWCYGSLPLRAAHRFLTLVKQPENAEVLRAELHSINGLYEDHCIRRPKRPIPAVPSPYLAYLLLYSWNVDIEDPENAYTDGRNFWENVLDVNDDPRDQSNNDGITVLDITDPTTPSYCFVSISGLESSKRAPRCVPLSATQYGRAYYPKPTPEKLENERTRAFEMMIQATIASLEGETVMKRGLLEEAWPYIFRSMDEEESSDEEEDQHAEDSPDEEEDQHAEDSPDEEEDQHGEDNPDQANNNTIAQTTEEAGDSSEVVQAISVPSLVEMTLKPAIARAVETSDIGPVENLLWLPGRKSIVKSILLEREPFPSGGMPLLKKVVTDERHLDLSHHSFTPEQLIEIVAECKSLEWLNISFNPTVTSEAIEQMLSVATPTLRRLVLLGCDSLNDNHLCDLMHSKPALFKNLDALICPMTIGRVGHAMLPNTFSYLSSFNRGMSEHSAWLWGSTMSVATPARIVQCLIDFLAPCASSARAGWVIEHLGTTYAAFTASRKPGQRWSMRSVVDVPQFSRISPFKGEGWVFVLKTLYNQNIYKWGFVRWRLSHAEVKQSVVDQIPSVSYSDETGQGTASLSQDDEVKEEREVEAQPESTYVPVIHDVRSFLRLMYEDGRPEAPEDAVAKLETILEKLCSAGMLQPDDLLVIPKNKWREDDEWYY